MSEISEKKDCNDKEIKVFNSKQKFTIIGICIIFVLLVVVSIYLLNKTFELRNELEKEKSLSVEGIEFKNVGKLIAQETRVTVIKNYQDDREFLKTINIPFTKYVYIFSYDVEVDAYVNFENVTYQANDKNKSIVVSLPHSKLNDNSSIINDSKKILYDNKNMFNSIKPEQVDKFQKEMVKEAETKAVDLGILKKADKYAKVLIENMVKSNSTYYDYNVEFNYID